MAQNDNAIAHLCAAGLSPDEAKAVCDGTGASTVSDLALLKDDVSAVACAAGLLLVASKKLAIAVNLAAAIRAPPLPAVDLSASATSRKTHDDGTAATATAAAMVDSLPPPSPSASSAAAAVPSVTVAAPALEECVAIAIDRSGSMAAGFDEMLAWCDDGNQRALTHSVQKRSRMDAVKQVFYAFRDRTGTVGGAGSHCLGLLQFDDRVERMLEPSSDLDVFEAVVDSMEHRGSTAIYSAIVEATRMLAPTFRAHPRADLRVLVLTDGNNNAGTSAQEALAAAHEIGAVVDAIIVGDAPDDMLRRIVRATGGSCYQIQSLSEGFELMEAEAVVSLRARRGGADKPSSSSRAPMTQEQIAEALGAPAAALVRGGDAAKAAAQAAPPRARATKVLAVGALCGDRDAAAKAVAAAEAGAGLSRGAAVRVMKELTKVAKGTAWQHGGAGGIHVFPDADNLALMRVLIEGPAGSPFEGGLFALHVTVPPDYPFRAPRVEFEAPVPYHCNVGESGAICLDELHSGWTPSLTIPRVLEAVRAMLAHPCTDSALRQWIAELTIASRKSAGADTRYVDAAREATKRDAATTLEEYTARWGVGGGGGGGGGDGGGGGA
jgi:ubiquitin-protein ligase